jgi:hypothetical protein
MLEHDSVIDALKIFGLEGQYEVLAVKRPAGPVDSLCCTP